MAGNVLEHVMSVAHDGGRQMVDTTLLTKAANYGGKNTGTCDKCGTRRLETSGTATEVAYYQGERQAKDETDAVHNWIV